jgi:hypothetical protein
MSNRFRGFVMCGLACLPIGMSTHSYGCDCQTRHAVSMAMPGYGGFAMASHMMGPMIEEEIPGDLLMGHSGSDLDVAPRGTIGQTYTRVSHAIPIDKHPRTAMLAVKDNGTIPYLTVDVMGGIKMKNGIWLFESTRPLDPGANQIVRVEARQTPQDIEAYDVRFVRLIPGRIVYLEF